MKKIFKIFMAPAVAMALACAFPAGAYAQNLDDVLGNLDDGDDDEDNGGSLVDPWGNNEESFDGLDLVAEFNKYVSEATSQVVEEGRLTLRSLLSGALSLIGAASQATNLQLEKLNAQQILQHSTDKNRTDAENRAREDLLEYVTLNAQRLAVASPYYEQFKKLINQAGYLNDVTQTLRTYQSFLMEYGDESSIQSSTQVLRYFSRASDVVVEQFKGQLQLFQKQERNKEINAVDALNFITNLTESLGSYLGNISMDCVDDMERLCYNQKVRMMTEKNRKSMSISIM